MSTTGNHSPFSKTGTAAQRAVSHIRPTILIAEDSADSREMMQQLFRLKGYEVVAAGDGLRAVEAALRTRPDVIFIDLQLPKLDGLSVTKNLRSHPELQRTPIFIVSGHDPARYRQAALDAGCNDYLLKPIDFDRLDQVLREIVPATSVLS
jgi:two-component system, sensor histidine kinase